MKDDTTTVRILLLEDSALDADLVAEHLSRGGIAHSLHRVWTREAFEIAIRDCPDLILADFTLPSFDGMAALDIARAACPHIPFIFVSATLGEEVAVEALKNGATDYVVKARLARLPGSVLRALDEVRTRTAREDAEEALRASRVRLDAALDIARLGTFEWNSVTDDLILDARSQEIVAGAPECVDAFLDLVHPGERSDLEKALHHIVDGGRIDRELRLCIAGTDPRDVMLVCDHGGDGVAYGILFDVTERRAAERRQLLIVRELHHRVKNSLASVQSIVNFTLRTSDTMEDFASSIRRRIRSLAVSHTMLTDNEWTGIHLQAIVQAELQPYDPSRVVLSGPDIQLPAEVALAFALAVHEMTTNAAKYGALSVPDGRVDVRWTMVGQDLVFDWTERDGPPVQPPSRRGFGSILLEQALGNQIRGTVRQDFAPEGVCIHITAHLD